MPYITLADLPLGRTACIHILKPDGDLRRRLMDLGFSSGIPVTALFRSPFGDPTAYQILGSVVALRKRDAKQIEISLSKKEEL